MALKIIKTTLLLFFCVFLFNGCSEQLDDLRRDDLYINDDGSQNRPVISSFSVLLDNKTYRAGDLVSVDVGDVLHYEWHIEKATLVESYFSIDVPDACGNNYKDNPWIVNNFVGETTVAVSDCQEGTTYSYYLKAVNNYGIIISQPLKIKVNKQNNPENLPKISSFRAVVNGIHIYVASEAIISLKAGTQITYSYEFENATSYKKYFVIDKQDKCGRDPHTIYEWNSSNMNLLDNCQIGTTYSLYIRASNDLGITISKPIKIFVITNDPGEKPKIDYFKLSYRSLIYDASPNMYRVLRVSNNEWLTFSWNIIDANIVESYYKSEKPDACGGMLPDNPWIINTSKGVKDVQAKSCQIGNTYLYYIRATNIYGTSVSYFFRIHFD